MDKTIYLAVLHHDGYNYGLTMICVRNVHQYVQDGLSILRHLVVLSPYIVFPLLSEIQQWTYNNIYAPK